MSGGTSQCNCDLCTGVGGKRLGAPDGMTWRNKGKQPARNDRSVRRGKSVIMAIEILSFNH